MGRAWLICASLVDIQAVPNKGDYIIKHRNEIFFRFVLLALVLLVVALVSALTAMRFAIHGSEIAVPDLVGKTPAEARRIADAAGFQMEVERQYYSADVPEGKIVSQVPFRGRRCGAAGRSESHRAWVRRE